MRSEGYEGLWDTGWAGDYCRLPCRARIFHLHLPRLSDRAEGPAWHCRKGGGCCGASVSPGGSPGSGSGGASRCVLKVAHALCTRHEQVRGVEVTWGFQVTGKR